MDDSEFSEFRSEISEFYSDVRTGGGRIMSSVAAAKFHTRALAEMLAPNGNWKEQVNAIHRRLADPKFPVQIERLTWSRVKSWLFGEARRIDWEKIKALEELRAAEEARRDRREFTAHTNRMAALLASQGASLTGEQMAVLARLQSRSDDVSRRADARPGTARRCVSVSGGGQ